MSMRGPVILALFFGSFLHLGNGILFRPLFIFRLHFIVGAIAIMCCLIAIADDSTSTNSVYKLQVGLLGLKSCSLKKDLNCIAETADTSTSEGLQYVLTEATLALIRHSYSGIHYDASSFSVKESADKVEKRFKQLSIEERDKFDNINKKKKKVTILVAAKGVHSYLPFIKKGKDLKDALLKLATIPYSSTLLVLWTPQDEDDTPPSEEEFLED
ncbi:hypothetical protein ACJIZ3_020095 [Penstemon smallii]|uniref:Uncharacterized protein n=1 Tax=Penstemon smallii TaxID=265156 RepID=A0ABD3SI12_9LAMI